MELNEIPVAAGVSVDDRYQEIERVYGAPECEHGGVI
jgi:hypothetical protein